MSSELTDKTMVVVSRLGDFWVSPTRSAAIMQIKQTDSTGSIELDGNLISCQSIDGIVNAQAYEILTMKRRGGWQCKYKQWHERNQQCAHGQMICN